VGVSEVLSERTAMTRVHRALCGRDYIVVLVGHTSRQMSRPLPANSVTQSSQLVAVRFRIDCCSSRHEFNVDNSCILEYRCYNFSSRMTRFDFFFSESLGVVTAFQLVLFKE
jgi:hypothetical protein